MRLDQYLVLMKIYPTRAKAVAAIKSGLVFVNDKVADKPSMSVSDSDVVSGKELPYVSGRGSLKLLKALDFFNVNPAGYVCLDVGASTGGFTEVLLNRGAKRVFAVDVGSDQLVQNLKDDSRVVSLEKTDIRSLKPIEKVDLIVIDVSFISLTNIIEFLPQWGADKIIALIKPQFEVSRQVAAKYNGVIKSDLERENAVNKVKDYFERYGFKSRGVIESPIHGGSGNIEYLIFVTKDL